MARRLRARNDIDWRRAGIGTAVGLVLAPAVPIAASYMSRWTGRIEWFELSLFAVPLLMIVAIWLIGRDIWSRLIIGLLAVVPTGLLVIAIVFFFGCPLVPGGCTL